MTKEFSIIGLILVPAIFLFYRKALREKNSFLIILGICIVCSVLAIISLKSAENGKPNFELLWFCPLYSLLLYRILLIPFWARKKRDPKIVSKKELLFNPDKNLADRFFGFTFFLLSTILPMYLIIKDYM
ncbi:hypothetical protein [Flavobacterium sp.]|uniref:hypothetical protein n=2 Tax=Flavobacterium sp. TaxID=239 RepID=UPI002FDA5322